jgi:hypothetical protein
MPGVFKTLEGLARHYLVERSDEEIGVCAEIRTESPRSPEIARIHQSINSDVEAGLVGVLKKAVERGEISGDIDLKRAVIVLLALGDGLEWRRATDPSFNIETVFPHIMQVARCLLGARADGKESV